MAGALDGIRVIDFGQWLAGPLTALLLADQGAEVIHVDPPDGPRWQTPANATLQRGKQHFVLDLKSAADRVRARALIDSADILIENFRPGVIDRLGPGWDSVRRDHDRLIYCSLPGFASDDPRAAMPAWEGVLAAATGTYTSSGTPARSLPGRRRATWSPTGWCTTGNSGPSNDRNSVPSCARAPLRSGTCWRLRCSCR